MKAYTVFNVEQIEGLPAVFYEKPAPVDEGRTVALIAEAEEFFADRGGVPPWWTFGVLCAGAGCDPVTAVAGVP